HFIRAGLSEARAEEHVANLATQPAVGTPDQIVETLRGLEAQGMTYAITYFQEAAYDTSGIDLFENYVIPELITKGE
ncbi:MAG: LLM class F420-dependent oxidoreductase, partial [Oryzihumus sp.]